jgi:hypothetical protein
MSRSFKHSGGYAKDGELDAAAAAVALDDLHTLDLQRHAHEPLLDRVWELRHNLSAYDAVYVALAEVLDTKVLTCDGRLAVKVAGPLYDKIALEKDLVVDIVPPDLYLGAEANTQLLAFIVAKDPAEMQMYLQDYRAAEKAFETSNEKHNRVFPPGHVKDLLNGTTRVERLSGFA